MVKEVISSAGIVYLYLNGYKENNKLYIQPVDTYHYMGEGFYRKVMENAAVDDQDDSVAHIFAIVGKKDKVKQIYALFENSLNENFKRIVAGKHIQKSLDMLDTTGNFFFQCVQEFFCEQLSHFPKRIDYDCEDFVVNGICCSHLANGDGDSLVDEMLSLWLNREKPALCGKQLMTQSFFLCDFVGRKVIASIPEMDTASWRFIFEGGHQLSLDAERPYSKETLHPSDLGQFCSSNMQSILMNPIYAYGVWLQPNDICEEWHKAFLYLCAVSDIDWDRACFLKIYETFLTFLKKNICVAMDTSPFISKELYCDALLIHVQHFLDFLKGEDEPVLSKDLHQTMNSRYVYLPYLWPLLSQKPCIKSFQKLI